MPSSTDPRANNYRRLAATVTTKAVLHPSEKQAAVDAVPVLRRRRERSVLEAQWLATEQQAATEAREVIAAVELAAQQVGTALSQLAALRRPRLFGKVEEEQTRVQRALARLSDARTTLVSGDFAQVGKAVQDAERLLFAVGGPLMMALNQELTQSAFSRGRKEELGSALQRRAAAQAEVETARQRSEHAAMLAVAPTYERLADFLRLTADILREQVTAAAAPRQQAGGEFATRVVQPQDLETFDDVGGLDEVKTRLRRTVGMILERARDAARMGIVHNGILLYGPPGTGKTLLARALAGEYGLRFVRFSPAAVASSYAHEPARRLRELFALAEQSVPCLLFLDEIEIIGARRDAASSADSREVTTQLLNSLEESRAVPGLVIMGATNHIDNLDPALREGRFDSRIAVPLPEVEARRAILDVQLKRRGPHVDWTSIDLDEIAQQTTGRSGAALASIVTEAAERAMHNDTTISQGDLLFAIRERSGQDRAQTFEEKVTWDDVVLPRHTQERLQEILTVFQNPELGRQLGVAPPAGVLLYGPPGTGKTTIAKALATEVRASFYEQSAADLLSKYVGESEERVARLFARARENRPSIIFIDEIDALLKRRSGDSAAPWEERVVSQFLRELDGLVSATGVLLVGATNRLDIIDEAVRERRLAAIEVPLPDGAGRRKLLELVTKGVKLAADVDLGEVAEMTEAMSGADLKAIRNAAGMKALTRAARNGGAGDAAVSREDFLTALAERGVVLTPD
ncbi:MAG TPA: AAA family ATPase [Candidatus Dormibacteraeota bacterium]|jgi:transitional endoplasmic reticulum ATPase|nr:AAA family ATPase [Candidatus Dormibacteraeota bacterium]